ncbi:MAG TPA: bifunctional 5,10-methylenetetrahydrofolate dehydrogenase/5,10-methenyltetrahydrofolate cyclohydrolase [Candidatus Paceibacterota bacterium]|nr:bifunctional 5,10-methylenetetrahydrofolate dehydrogenase/5,10-methenyltetrahydrofolate cyclohydrolase [Candidatus Paceibacterota bacterium]
MTIIDGRKIRDDFLEEIKIQVRDLKYQPELFDITVGQNKLSDLYANLKLKFANQVGFKSQIINFPETITTEEIILKIKELNEGLNTAGIIVQLPLPPHINSQKVLDSILPELDVDCLGQENSQAFYEGRGDFIFPTAKACLYLLDKIGLDLKGKKIVVVGNGKLVGRPVSYLLEKRGYSVKNITKQSNNPKDDIKKADVIISAAGQANFIKEEMVKEGVVIIDAGTSEENGSIKGDVDFEKIAPKSSFITRSPGGVGPVTLAMLLTNVLQVAKMKKTSN